MVTLMNTGTENLNITSIVPSAAFAVTDDCDATLVPNGFCTLNITFSPTAVQDYTGSITITDNASDSPQEIALIGKGTDKSGPQATFSTNSMDFGDVYVGTTSEPKNYMITNDGTEDLVISDIEMQGINPENFSKESNCQETLRPGEYCEGKITFKPTESTIFWATINFTDNASNSPQSINLVGNGIPPVPTGGGCSLVVRR
jgi:hypothetical protein